VPCYVNLAPCVQLPGSSFSFVWRSVGPLVRHYILRHWLVMHGSWKIPTILSIFEIHWLGQRSRDASWLCAIYINLWLTLTLTLVWGSIGGRPALTYSRQTNLGELSQWLYRSRWQHHKHRPGFIIIIIIIIIVIIISRWWLGRK